MTAWHQHTFAVIDFETTGPDPETCIPVQVAVVVQAAEGIQDRWSCLINPGVPIPAEASAIHGITDEMVATAPSPSDAIQEAHRMARKHFPCGYNGDSFDRVIWERYAESMGQWLDPLVMVRHVDRYVSGKGRHKLEVTCKRWGVELTNAHDALADCEATGALLFSERMRQLLGDMSLDELLQRQQSRREEQDKAFQEWLAKQPPREKP